MEPIMHLAQARQVPTEPHDHNLDGYHVNDMSTDCDVDTLPQAC